MQRWIIFIEAAVQRFSQEKVFWKYAGNLQENTDALCWSVISNFIEITLRHACSPVNLLHIFRTLFLKNTSGRLLLSLLSSWPVWKMWLNTELLSGLFLFSSLREKCPCSELFQSISLRSQSECGKIRTRITPNTDAFYAVPR